MRSLFAVLSCAVLFCVMSFAAPAQASFGQCVCPPVSKPVVRKHVKKPAAKPTVKKDDSAAKAAEAALRACQQRNVQRRESARQCIDYCLSASVCIQTACQSGVERDREICRRQDARGPGHACMDRLGAVFERTLADCDAALDSTTCDACRPVLENCGK